MMKRQAAECSERSLKKTPFHVDGFSSSDFQRKNFNKVLKNLEKINLTEASSRVETDGRTDRRPLPSDCWTPAALHGQVGVDDECMNMQAKGKKKTHIMEKKSVFSDLNVWLIGSSHLFIF